MYEGSISTLNENCFRDGANMFSSSIKRCQRHQGKEIKCKTVSESQIEKVYKGMYVWKGISEDWK